MKISPNKIAAFKANRNFSGPQHRYIDQLAEANIPITYWELPMSKFQGSEEIKNATLQYANNIKENYADGKGLVFAGNYGIGKTYAMCSLLKATIRAGYTAYYTSITDMGIYIYSKTSKEEYMQKCMKSDFLVFDEVDSRHIPTSDDGAAFFGTSVEKIVRERVQNKLPTFFATNNSGLSAVFTGQYERAIVSLLSPCSTTITAIGKDYRKTKND